MPNNAFLKLCTAFLLVTLAGSLNAQTTEEGREIYDLTCARCHGGDAQGGESGPSVLLQISARTDADLATYLQTGTPDKGMPPVSLDSQDLNRLIGYLRSMVPLFTPGPSSVDRRTLTLGDGSVVEGLVINEGFSDLQIRDEGGQIHLLRKLPNSRYREVTSEVDWSSYNGKSLGNRHSEMTQITPENVNHVGPLWSFPLPVTGWVQTTPVVENGVMYVSSANEAWALDAGTGRELWHYQRPKTPGLSGNATFGVNRGMAVNGDKVFMLTDNAHMIALSSSDGSLLWETEMADWNLNYNSTNAPLVAGNVVVGGHAGGDEGVRGFLSAYDIETGEEAWRFWTIPDAGAPGSETWESEDNIEHGAGATWMTGSYDPELNVVYWQTGNPGPDFFGDNREGDNLYTDSVIALDADSGELLWHYQFTPHDVHDWDAQEPLALVDVEWEGEPRKLLLQANRNGFFYVLDRVSGELLLAESFLNKLNWAEGIDDNGRPILNELELTPAGETYVCPGFQGGTNWYSTAYNPDTGYYYIQALERCMLFSKRDQEWVQHASYMGGTARQAPGEGFTKSVRAIDIRTGEIAFDIVQGNAPSTASAGLLTTASGLIFFGENTGSFIAADASTGEVLWEFSSNHTWRSSPMTYMFDGKQYIAVAMGTTITAFGLNE